MVLISNTTGNHIDSLKLLFKQSTERLIIVSPFLAGDMQAMLQLFDFSSVKKLELISTYKENDIEQLTKPNQFKDCFEYFSKNYVDMEFRLHVNNCLHGKLYISLNEDESNMILTSANFTQNGLSKSHEWGVSISDQQLIEQTVCEVYDALEYYDVTHSQIKRACSFLDQYKRDHNLWADEPEPINMNVLSKVYSDFDESKTEFKYFLKPIGSSEEPVELDSKRDFSGLHQSLHFSKKYPKGVSKGDVLITTAIGAGSLLSYFRVTGPVEQVTSQELKDNPRLERWPYYMEGKNQSQGFGKLWWKYDLRRKVLLEEFKSTFQDIPVTFNGGFSLGTLNRGNDKVRITKEFAEFLISKINNCKE